MNWQEQVRAHFEGAQEHGGPGRRGRGRGAGRPGGWQNVDLPSADDAEAWFRGRLPNDWYSEVTVTLDREEITVVLSLAGEAGDRATAEGLDTTTAVIELRPLAADLASAQVTGFAPPAVAAATKATRTISGSTPM